MDEHSKYGNWRRFSVCFNSDNFFLIILLSEFTMSENMFKESTSFSIDKGFIEDLLDISVEEERKSLVIFPPHSLPVTSVSTNPYV